MTSETTKAEKPSQLMRWLRHLPALLGVGLLFGAIYVVQHEFRHLRLAEIKRALHSFSWHSLGWALVWTLLAYAVLTLYDRLGTIYAGHKVSYRRVAFASFCAYTLSHNLGFPAVSGAAVRYRLYAHWGLAPLEIAKVVAFCSLTFGLGGMTLGGLILFLEPGAVPFFGDHLPHWVMYAFAALLWAIALTYVSISAFVRRVKMFGHEAELPGPGMAVLQVALATVDVAVTAAIFYALLPVAPGLSFPRFMAVYLASYSAGLAANLPGGIGVFDSAMLIGLADYCDPPTIVGAIVVFRLYYYIIPLFLAGSLFTGNEILLRGGSLFRSGRAVRAVEAVGSWSEPDFAIGAATGVVALCGAMLLALAVLSPRPDFSWLDPDLGDMASSAGEFVPSLIGAGLMVLAIGLSHRVKLAWGSTVVLLLAGAAFTAADGYSAFVPTVLVLAAVLVAPFRGAFYRHARLIKGPLEASTLVPLFALLACILVFGVFNHHVRFLRDNSWWELIVSPDLPNAQRVTVAMTMLIAVVALWRLIRPGRVDTLPWNASARLRYASMGAIPPMLADGLLLGEAERAAIPFRRMHGMLIGLGDPAGAWSDKPSVIWRLHDLAQQEGLDAAVWRAGPDLLKIYRDLGLTPLPLDKDGLPVAAPDRDKPATTYLCCLVQRDLHRLVPLLRTLAREG